MRGSVAASRVVPSFDERANEGPGATSLDLLGGSFNPGTHGKFSLAKNATERRVEGNEKKLKMTKKRDASVAMALVGSAILIADFNNQSWQAAAAATAAAIAAATHHTNAHTTAFASAWAAAALLALAHTARAIATFGVFSLRAIGVAFHGAAILALLAVWTSLHLGFLADEQPALARLGERLLVDVAPLPCAAIVSWVAGILYGAAAAPYALSAALVAGHCVCAGLSSASATVSPGGPAGVSGGASVVRSRTAARTTAWLGSALPPLQYASVHRMTLSSSWRSHTSALLVLACLPPLLLEFVSAAGLGPSEHGGRTVRFACVLGLCCAGHLHMSSSLEWMMILSQPALLSETLLLCTFATPFLWLPLRVAVFRQQGVPWAIDALLGCIGGGAAATALGLPMASQLSLVVAFSSGAAYAARRKLAYAAVSGLALVHVAASTLHRLVGYLEEEVTSDALAGDASPTTLSALLVSSLALCVAAALVSLAASTEEDPASGSIVAASSSLAPSPRERARQIALLIVLVAHAAVESRLELALAVRQAASEDTGLFSGPWPPPFALASFGFGLLLCSRLLYARIALSSAAAWWLLFSLHVGRGVLMLLEPTPGVLATATLAALAFSQPIHRAIIANAAVASGARVRSEPPLLILGRLLLVVAAVAASQRFVAPSLVRLLTPGPVSPHVSIGIQIAASAAVAASLTDGGTCEPPRRDLVGGPLQRRVWILAGTSGVLIGLIRPSTDLSLVRASLYQSLFTTAGAVSPTDEPPLWPSWLLVMVLLAVAACALHVLPWTQLSDAGRVAAVATAGASANLSACGASLTPHPLLFAVYALLGSIGASLVAFSLFPAHFAQARARRMPITLACVGCATLPLGLHLQRRTFTQPLVRALGAAEEHRTFWLGFHACIAALMAITFKVRVVEIKRSAAARGSDADVGDDDDDMQTSPLRAELAATAWLGPMGNVCSAYAALISHWTNVSILGGTARGSLFAASGLLLLQPREWPLRRMHNASRFSPPLAFVALALSVDASAALLSRAPWGALRGAALVACALPSLLVGLHYFWASSEGRMASSGWSFTELQLLLILLPPNLLPILLASSPEIRDMGIAGVSFTLVQLLDTHAAHFKAAAGVTAERRAD